VISLPLAPRVPATTDDLFACVFYRATMRGRVCVERQGTHYVKRGKQREDVPIYEHCASGKCEQGRELAAAFGGVKKRTPRMVNLAAIGAARRKALKLEAPLITAEVALPDTSEKSPAPAPTAPEESSMDAPRKREPRPGGKCSVCGAPLFTNAIKRGTCSKHKDGAATKPVAPATNRVARPPARKEKIAPDLSLAPSEGKPLSLPRYEDLPLGYACGLVAYLEQQRIKAGG